MRYFSLFLLVLAASACHQVAPPVVPSSPTPPRTTTAPSPTPLEYPKNIILMIGDGMGLTQISAGLYRNDNKLHLEQFKVVGLHKSYSSSNLITDSAAGATAFSAGVKTYNGAIGVGKDSLPVVTILEEAQQRGMATGLVATASVVHATPASFAAHIKSRASYEDIAADMADADVDLLIGGGRKYFERRTKDQRDLSDEMARNGYIVSDFTQKSILQLRPDNNRKLLYFTAEEEPLTKAEGRDYLPAASRLACDFLQRRGRDNGFFLMVEGAQIDWGGHANNSSYIISEMIDFDEAIGQVLEFARQDGNTLVIVTADHETGGYSINQGSSFDTIFGGFTTTYHTAALIPVFAYGPGAELFGGIYENTAIYDKMKLLLVEE